MRLVNSRVYGNVKGQNSGFLQRPEQGSGINLRRQGMRMLFRKNLKSGCSGIKENENER